MKRKMVTLGLALVAGAACAAPIAENGKAVSAVTTERTDNKQIGYAAQELTNWVAKLSGAVLPVDPKAEPAGVKTRILLGTPETSKEVARFAAEHTDDFGKLGESDGFIIDERKGCVTIAAKKTKGVLNGVYRFLEKNSDIIWVRPMQAEDGFGTIYGNWPNFENTIEHLVDVPSLVESRAWSGSRTGARWQARLLNNQRMHTFDLGDALYYDTSDVYIGLFLSFVDCYKETNPEIFPLHKGERDTKMDHHLCFMNPKTAELFIKESIKRIEEAPDFVHRAIIGLGDHHKVCTCDLCVKPIVCSNGTVVKPEDRNFRATQYAIFVNKVSDAITKRFPRMKPIRMFSYIFTADGPGEPVRAGVDRYCPYVKNHKKPVYDDSVNATWHRKAESFIKAGMPICGLYEYYLCYTTPRFYHAISEVAQKDYGYYLERGLKDCYLDAGPSDEDMGDGGGAKTYDISGIEFWVQSRLMWDVNIDLKATRREFCRRAFREAGDVMGDYYETLAKNYNDDPTGCYWNDDPVIAAKHYVVEKGLAGWVRETLAKAEAAAKHPGSKELIRRHRAQMECLVDKAEKAPKRVTHVVPQKLEKPDNRPDGAYWRDVPLVEPILKTASSEPGSGQVTIKVAHDRENLFMLFTSAREGDLKRFREAKAKGLVGKPLPKGEGFPWGSAPPIEFYFDGKLAAKGNYFMFAAAVTEVKTMCWGSAAPEEPFDWTIKFEEIDGKLVGLLRFSLADMGVDISKGNKIGAMFVSCMDAWNGGQWHSPGSFQTLMLEMK